ncbi:MAG: hypothetical protein RIC55_18940 [Pirellulaceae bacterium]
MIVARMRLVVVSVALLAAVLLSAGASAQEKTRSAAELLPEKTLVFVRIADTKDLAERFQKTAIGRIGADESIRPLVGDLYDSAVEGFANLEDRVGASLEELLKMPQGEVCLALLKVEGQRPALVAFVEVGESSPTVDRVLEHVDDALAERGAFRETEMVGETELVIHKAPERSRQLIRFRREGKVVLATDPHAAYALLARWNGEAPKDERPLTANKNFQTIMKRCRLGDEKHPQLSFYADPIELADAATQGNFGARAVLAMIPALGLDGVQGVGGSITLAEDEYDVVTHLHLALENPREGALEMLAMTSGDTTPEDFIPHDASTYMTVHWDVEKTFVTFGELFDTFRGDGALADEVDRRISGPLGVDLKDDVLAELSGRFTRATWIEPPARVNSQASLVSAKLRDPKRFRGTLERIAAKVGDRFDARTYGGVDYYFMELPRPGRPRDAEELPDDARPNLRQPQLCLAVLGEFFVATDSEALLKHAVGVRGDAMKQLANELEFKLIASKIARESGERTPGMILFDRPEENIRLLYDLAAADDVRSRIGRRGEENGFFQAISGALNDNPLPPFPILSRYLAPGGGMMTSDATGLHYMGFTLRSAAND